MKKNYELFSTGPALKLMPKEVLQAKKMSQQRYKVSGMKEELQK